MSKPSLRELERAPKRTQIIVRVSELEIQSWKTAAREWHLATGGDETTEASMSAWVRHVLNHAVTGGK